MAGIKQDASIEDSVSANLFTSFGELERRLKALPPPRAGFVRVFRGQTKHYGSMRPSGLRNHPLRNEEIWLWYVSFLTYDLCQEAGLSREDCQAASWLWSFWYYAIAQHYGPGSRLLDVSYALEVALYFALHGTSTAESIGLMGPDDPGDPSAEVFRRTTWVQFYEWRDEPGWLYVFDVPEWDQRGLPDHGVLVDLTKAPTMFAGSARIIAQAACLIAADRATENGDLTGCYACPPLRVAWPMDGCDLVKAEVGRLFPPPWNDQWYDRLLHLPMVHHVDHQEPNWHFGHPVSITLYLPQEISHEIQAISARFKTIAPPLLFPELVRPALDGSAYSEKKLEAIMLSSAEPILLEAPVFAAMPEGASDLWNVGLLTEDLPYTANATDFLTGAPLEPVPLEDIFIELSPLEKVGWQRLEQPNVTVEMLRAVHLTRRGEWTLQLFIQWIPETKILTLGPVPVRFNEDLTRFEFLTPGGWDDVKINPYVSKGLFVSLTLLRDLSPTLKPRAFPDGHPFARPGESQPTMSVRVARAVATLVKLPEVRTGWGYYHVKNPRTGEPYFRGEGGLGELEISASLPFSRLDAAMIRNRAAEVFGGKKE